MSFIVLVGTQFSLSSKRNLEIELADVHKKLSIDIQTMGICFSIKSQRHLSKCWLHYWEKKNGLEEKVIYS